jgi:serine/threonine-protein kinase
VHDPEVHGGERAKVLDFGIAKLSGDHHVKTQTSAVMGTPAYMSPEQCRGAGHVDQRSDVYALGCMIFALVTGAPPFDSEGGGEIIAMHLREPPPVLSSRMPGVPAELDALVMRCLAKDPAQRYASGTELAAAIGAMLGSASNPTISGAGTSMAQLARSAVSVTTLSSAAGSASSARPRSSSRVVVATVAGVLIVGGGITAVVVGRGDTHAPVVSTTPAAPEAKPLVRPPDPLALAVAPPAPDPDAPNAELAKQMKTVLGSFVAWSRDHAGTPCPAASALGAAVRDPWGHAIELTCTDQPAKQIAGAISAGPDGVIGTQDDIGSWQLGRDVTDVVHGPRWVATRQAEPPAPPEPQPKPGKPPKPRPRSDDDIPTAR